MRKYAYPLVFASGLAALAIGAGEDEQEISMDQVPSEARAALLRHAGKTKIDEVNQVTEDGDTLYEGTLVEQERKTYVKVTAEGALVEVDEVVSAQAVPPAVRHAAEKKFGADAKLGFEKDTTITYTVKGPIGGKIKEIEFTPSGKIQADAAAHGTKP